MSGALIELRGVTRRYSQGQDTALDGIDLTIDRGEFVAIVGQSGAGKSTLLNVLGLLDLADGGEYVIDGIDTRELGEEQRDRLRAQVFGFVFQDSFVLPGESVSRNVALPLRMRGASPPVQVESVTRALDRFDMLHTADQTAGTLSGGERQRVAFARAVAGDPLVVLADEPTGNLDSRNTARVMDHLAHLNADGTTVVIVTHSAEVARAARRTVTISDGRIESDVVTGPRRRPPARRDGGLAAPSRPRRSGWRIGDALSALLLSPLRTLTMLAAFVIAIAGLVTAVNMSATAADQISEKLSAAALDEVTILLNDPDGRAEELESVRGIDGVVSAGTKVLVAGTDSQPHRTVGTRTVSADSPVVAIDRGFLAVGGVTTSPTHAAELIDAEDGTPVAILGHGAAEKLGIANDRVGDTIVLAGQEVLVAGFIRSAERDAALPHTILVSLADFTVPRGSDSRIVIRTAPGLPAKVAEALPLALDPVQPGNVIVQTVADLRRLTTGVNADLAVNVLVISSVLLVLVCLTSSVSMFLTVLSRTREIALRRAVGATRSDIRFLFLLEGSLLGLAGGIAGLAVGIAATTTLSMTLGWVPTFDLGGALVAVAAGTLAGALSAVLPAIRAARLEPALALRGT
ncbi:ABC transporter ATP-binding protein/permease [Microbacterium sp. No. 7]|uniref:ABC transporter ATP-binding protein/permease n=1 Tax=Microbacterium sp. No. 7 TaxID=1714373 RepID=UPI0006D21283|nr:ABC transporter ATP-binding protein/permease [Microbacterium sp. No. 7]ALJ21804.1 hypothetical protein AOA12_18645 [Microbacterium sp. No. 7]